jgi:hypothetical protein
MTKLFTFNSHTWQWLQIGVPSPASSPMSLPRHVSGRACRQAA